MVGPRTSPITHIAIKSQPERHTINGVELAASVVSLKQENTEDHMSILTDSSFCINTIRNYTRNLAACNQHLHKDLLQLTNQLLKDRDHRQLRTHIGKVKSHTDVEYSETADKAARAVVDGENSPDVTFEDAGPSFGGLRPWQQIRHNPTNKPGHIRKLTNLKAGIKKELKHTHKKPQPQRAFWGNSYKRQETQE